MVALTVHAAATGMAAAAGTELLGHWRLATRLAACHAPRLGALVSLPRAARTRTAVIVCAFRKCSQPRTGTRVPYAYGCTAVHGMHTVSATPIIDTLIDCNCAVTPDARQSGSQPVAGHTSWQVRVPLPACWAHRGGQLVGASMVFQESRFKRAAGWCDHLRAGRGERARIPC